MTHADFAALLERRDRLEREHTTACEILAEGECDAVMQYRRCARLYEQVVRVQEQIDAECAAERAEEASVPPPAA